MAKGTNAPINPDVLRWAIETSGHELGELASRLDLQIDILNNWIEGLIQPNLTQFKKLAKLLNRPTATFFLPTPPTSIIEKVDIHEAPNSDRNRRSKDEIRYLRESLRLQQLFSWARKELGKGQAYIPKKGVSDHAEELAYRERSRLGISISQQFSWSGPSEAFNAWRKSTEEIGIFVFLVKMDRASCRGFSVWDTFAPLIAINTSWNLESGIFALFHQYGHLITKSNSVCANYTGVSSTSSDDPEEMWCDLFAVSLLLPWFALSKFLHEQFSWSPGKKIRDFNEVQSVASKFNLSHHAIIRRLIDRKAADWNLNSRIPRVYDRERSCAGIGRTRLQIKQENYGSSSFNLLLAAIEKGLVSRTDALTFLDITDSDLSNLTSR